MGRHADNLTGLRFGRLLVRSRAPSLGYNARWLCACDCGGERVVLALSLKAGRTKSCGCIPVGRRRTVIPAN